MIESCSETIMGSVFTTIIASSKLLLPIMVFDDMNLQFPETVQFNLRVKIWIMERPFNFSVAKFDRK